MRWKGFSWFLAFALLGTLSCAAYMEVPATGPAWQGGGEIELSVFFDALSPYGDWLWVEPWGWVWTPWDVEPGWRPYTHGRWVATPLGWTWISDWAWGWAPFHYGRWSYDSFHGWIWIPDRVWAPAWVAWRRGPGWIGWGPLPPQARWRVGIGLDLGGLDLGIAIVEHGWCFVPERDFLDRRLPRRLAPLPRHGHLLRETRDATRYEEVERRVAVRSIEVEEVERLLGAVRRYRIEDVEKPPRAGDAVEREAVRIYRPEVREGAAGRTRERSAPPPAPEVKPQQPPPAREQRELRAWERDQIERLEREHQQERNQPPAQEKPAEVQQRQQEERRALEREVEREKKLLENRRERRAKEKAVEKEKQPKVKPKPPVPQR
jgi:hypothetical protein